jgi:aryl-alcohol dehydrogenase-like predicted oxidoreductase
MTSRESVIPRRTLGRTGVRVSALGLGGSHIGSPKVSSAPSGTDYPRGDPWRSHLYGQLLGLPEGESEKRLGKALQGGYRSKAFVMTKIDGRTKKEAAKQLDESLKRVRLNEIDLLQHHEVIRYDDVDRIFSAGGAMEALVAARQAGKIRFIGFTGHKDPQVHLYMLENAKKHRFRFDTAQMPLNLLDSRNLLRPVSVF